MCCCAIDISTPSLFQMNKIVVLFAGLVYREICDFEPLLRVHSKVSTGRESKVELSKSTEPRYIARVTGRESEVELSNVS